MKIFFFYFKFYFNNFVLIKMYYLIYKIWSRYVYVVSLKWLGNFCEYYQSTFLFDLKFWQLIVFIFFFYILSICDKSVLI